MLAVAETVQVFGRDVPATAQEWGSLVRRDLAAAVEGIIAAGRHLCDAKAAVPHGEFGTVVLEAGISRTTAHMLMSIATHAVLSNVQRVEHLPASWGTLAELARVPADRVEAAIADGTITPAMDRRAAKLWRKTLESPAIDPAADTGSLDFRHGDFRAALADIEPGTVDLILTDPPYGPKYTHLYDALGEFAARTLKPGGSLIAYSGQSNLGEAWAALNAHLRYWWTLALEHRCGGQQLMGKRVICEWKPLLWFVRDRRGHDRWVADRVRGSGARKDLHEWAQGVEEVAYLVEQLTDPGDLVVDPFAGSGSFGYAAVELGRRFVGCDDGSHPDGRRSVRGSGSDQ